jgi:hypothetical protein
MIERGISDDDVRQVLANGKEIEDYSLAQPYPSRLLLGWSGARPIHVVVADNKADNEAIIVTVYESDLDRWESGLERGKLQ